MVIEWIEVQIAFSSLPADASDNLRITLVSPDGVHTELTNYTIPPSSLDPITPLDEDGNPTDTFPKWVFTTNRHWGERSGGNAVEEIKLDEETSIYLPRPWSLEFENWSEEDIQVAEIDIFFYGIDYTEVYAAYGPAAPGGRIQGVAGLDIDGDDDYNFNGLVNLDTLEFVRDPTEPLMVDGAYFPTGRETAASGAKIYVDVNKDGLHNDDVHNIVDANHDGVADFIEPYFITGADGNYYFDLPYSLELPDGSYTTYTIRQEPPAGTILNTNNPLFTESYEVTLLPDDMMTPELEHRELQANFLYTPSEIILEGTVFSDYNQNGVQDSGELGAKDFVVFIDANDDGIFQYYDINFNQKFDDGIDFPFEPVAVSTNDGSYSLSFGPGDPGFEGRSYYTLMLEGQDGWTMIEPTEGFYRIYTESGATNSNLDFAMYSGFGSIFGMVYYDFDEDGIHDPGEPPLNNWLVYIDADNDRIPDSNEPKLYTDNAGEYFFEELALGQYRVRVHAGSGWLQTSPDGDGSYLVDLYIGVGFPGNDFGFGGTNTFDYGDLPAPYPTTLSQDGARHPVLPTFYLGSSVDGEPDGQPSPNANGDDTNGLSDEDGILLLGPIVGKADLQVQVTANAANGYLQGWMDFNNNGSWDDAGERVFTDVLLNAGINNLTISVPATVTAGPIYSRFRYAENKIDSYTGPALGGEVEDYIFEAIPPRYADGDFNQDLVVDGVDLSIWNDGFGTVPDAAPSEGDADGDGDVDGNDFLAWQLGFGINATGDSGGGTAGSANSVPVASEDAKNGVDLGSQAGKLVSILGDLETGGVEDARITPSSPDSLADTRTTQKIGSSQDPSFVASFLDLQSSIQTNADSIRFDLALSELSGLAKVDLRTAVIEPIPVEFALPDAIPTGGEYHSRDLAIRELGAGWIQEHQLQREETVELLVEDRPPVQLDVAIDANRFAKPGRRIRV